MGYIRLKDDVYDNEYIIFPSKCRTYINNAAENGHYGLKLYTSSNYIMLIFFNEEKLNKVVEEIIEIKEKNGKNKSVHSFNGF